MPLLNFSQTMHKILRFCIYLNFVSDLQKFGNKIASHTKGIFSDKVFHSELLLIQNLRFLLIELLIYKCNMHQLQWLLNFLCALHFTFLERLFFKIVLVSAESKQQSKFGCLFQPTNFIIFITFDLDSKPSTDI